MEGFQENVSTEAKNEKLIFQYRGLISTLSVERTGKAERRTTMFLQDKVSYLEKDEDNFSPARR